jgi:hypothetical protein
MIRKKTEGGIEVMVVILLLGEEGKEIRIKVRCGL